MELDELLNNAPRNELIGNSLIKTHAKLEMYDKILCSVSGGSDSDILIDLCEKYEFNNKITYVFFDTGLEFDATKEHLSYLEQRYNVNIERIKALKPIPICCREYGQPFLSKQVSEWIERLQRHHFKWEDKPFDELYKEYPNCKAALRWWCNAFGGKERGKESSFNIASNQYLKEFMVKNPPRFKISNKCCLYAKKKVAHSYKEKGDYDLNIYGVRKAEGGVRRSAYKTCFSSNAECDEYRPIFWYLKDTKELYDKHYGIIHSRCYSEYGLKRTGCAGCPYSKCFEEELRVMEQYEPLLHKAVSHIFADSYAYARAYRNFILQKRNNTNKSKEMN